MHDSLGTIEKGKFADLIAVAGDPASGHHRDAPRQILVMKGGSVERDDLTARLLTPWAFEHHSPCSALPAAADPLRKNEIVKLQFVELLTHGLLGSGPDFE